MLTKSQIQVKLDKIEFSSLFVKIVSMLKKKFHGRLHRRYNCISMSGSVTELLKGFVWNLLIPGNEANVLLYLVVRHCDSYLCLLRAIYLLKFFIWIPFQCPVCIHAFFGTATYPTKKNTTLCFWLHKRIKICGLLRIVKIESKSCENSYQRICGSVMQAGNDAVNEYASLVKPYIFWWVGEVPIERRWHKVKDFSKWPVNNW